MLASLLIILLFVVRLKPSAPALKVIAEPAAHPCVVQYKNSLADVSQFNVSLISFEKLSKLNPCDSKYFPYPTKKSTTF